MSDALEAREAVRAAYQAHYRRLVAALYALTGDYAEAQDLVQEAYARALARPAQFLDVADPEAWLRTVAVNLARTRWRRRRLFDTLVRTGRVARPVEAVPGADPNRVALVAALQKLSRPTRETIVLHHLADMSVHEVAQALDVPVGTVKARLSRGRAMLATLLREHDTVQQEREPAPRGREPGTPGRTAAPYGLDPAAVGREAKAAVGDPAVTGHAPGDAGLPRGRTSVSVSSAPASQAGGPASRRLDGPAGRDPDPSMREHDFDRAFHGYRRGALDSPVPPGHPLPTHHTRPGYRHG